MVARDEAQLFLDSVLSSSADVSEDFTKVVKADAPLLVKSIYSIIESIKATQSKLVELQEKISSDSLPTSKGVSLLEVKLHSLLSYLTNLSFFILLKLQGKSTADGHPAIDQLIELRVILEKIKPIENKLKYQIDKVVKAANDAAGDAAGAEGAQRREVTELDLQAAGVSDPLQFKPNPMNLVGASTVLDNSASQSKEDGVYRPPRIAPVKYTEAPRRKKGEMSETTRENLSKSRLFRDLRDTFDQSRPEHVTSHGTGYGVREMRDAKDEELERIQEFELNNYTRLGATRDRNKREKAAMRKGGTTGMADELENLEKDFLQIDAVDRAVRFDDQERFGSSGSVLAKRNMRAETLFTGDESRKKGKYSDAGELLSKAVAGGVSQTKTAYDKALRRATKPRHRTLAKK